MKKLLFALVLTLQVIVTHAAPQRISASYDLFKDGQLFARVAETYEQTGKRYTIESTTTAVGVYALFAKGAIKLISSGEVTRNGLRPLHFEHHRGNAADKLISADFDWDKQTLTSKHDGETETVALAPDAQDRISQMYQLMFLPFKTKDISFHMTNGKNMSAYHYQRTGDEPRLTTQSGKFRTLHLVRQTTSGEDATELWLARDKSNFPLKILIVDDSGSKLEQTLVTLTLN